MIPELAVPLQRAHDVDGGVDHIWYSVVSVVASTVCLNSLEPIHSFLCPQLRYAGMRAFEAIHVKNSVPTLSPSKHRPHSILRLPARPGKLSSSPERGHKSPQMVDSGSKARQAAVRSPTRHAQIPMRVSTQLLPETPTVTIGDYVTQHLDARIAIKEAEMHFPRLIPLMKSLAISCDMPDDVLVKLANVEDSALLPGALGFEIVRYDHSFFADTSPPTIDASGQLRICASDLSGKAGNCTIEYRVVDYSNFVDEECTEFVHTQHEIVRLDISSASSAPLQRTKDWRAHKNKTSVAKTLVKEDPPQSLLSPKEQLEILGIRHFRVQAPQLQPAAFAYKFHRHEPLVLLRCCNIAAERQLLSSCSLPFSDLELTLSNVRALMKQKAPLTQLLPELDNACRLHFKAGGIGNLTTAQRLAKLRASVVGTTLGIDLDSENVLDMSVALRLSGSKNVNVQHFIRVLVEGAHLLKNTGELADALRFYRLGFNLASVVNETNRTASMIPFLVATGDVHLMRGETELALDCYERARSFAEANGGGSVVAECEDLIGLSYAMLGHHSDSQNAIQRSLRIREESEVPIAAAESFLFHAYCSAIRGASSQAKKVVEQAIAVIEEEGSSDASSKLLLVVAHCIAAWLEFDRPLSSDTRARLEKACELCTLCCGDSSAECCLPKWLLASYCAYAGPDSAAFNSLSRIHQTLSQHTTSGHTFAAAVYGASALVSDQADSALSCVDTTLAPVMVNYTSTSPIVFVFNEVETLVRQRWNCPSMKEGLHRLLWSCRNCSSKELINGADSFRISALLSEGFITDPSCPEEVDAVMDEMLMGQRRLHGEFATSLTPLLRDTAELRFAHGRYEEALELFGQALKIADTRNLLYLLGTLFKPEMLLSSQETSDRNRLAKERGMHSDSAECLGTLLFQIGQCHEVNSNCEHSIAAYHKALAVFEMSDLISHPCVVATLASVGRVLVSSGKPGDAIVYLDRAKDICFTHHVNYGAYKGNVQLQAVVDNAMLIYRAANDCIWRSNYVLVEHPESKHPNVVMYC